MEVSVASHAIDFRGREACVVIAEDVTEKERLRVQLQQSQRLESLGQLAGGVAHDFNNLLAVILGYASFIERRAEEGSQRRARRDRDPQGRRARHAAHPAAAVVRAPRGRPAEGARPDRRRDRDGAAAAPDARRARRPAHVAGAGPVADHGRPRAARAGARQPRGQRPRRDARRRHAHARHREHRRRRGLREHPHRAEPGPLRAPARQRHRASGWSATWPRGPSSRSSRPSPRARAPGSGWPRSTASSPRPAGTCRSTPSPGWAPRSRSCCRRPTRPCRSHADADRARARAGGGETILVVEDEPAMLEVTRRILAGNGYEVLVAGGGREAAGTRRASTPGPIDVLLTDVVMPEMLGKEVAERVTALRPGHPRAVHVGLRAAGDRRDGRPRRRPRDHRQAVHGGRAARPAAGAARLVPHLLDDLVGHRVLLRGRCSGDLTSPARRSASSSVQSWRCSSRKRSIATRR